MKYIRRFNNKEKLKVFEKTNKGRILVNVIDPKFVKIQLSTSSIFYETTDKQVVDVDTSLNYGANFESNTYDTVGEIKFDGLITTIPEGAFDGCDNLQSVIIPPSATEIESNAVVDCENLNNVTMSSDTTIQSDSFVNIAEKGSLNIDEDVRVDDNMQSNFSGWYSIVDGNGNGKIGKNYIPMYFENVDTKSVTIGVSHYVNNASSFGYCATLEYSFNGITWELWGTISSNDYGPSLKAELPVGGKLYIRTTRNFGYFNDNYTSYNFFSSTGKVNVGGNIMSLGYKDFEDKTSITQDIAYCYVFRNMTNLVDASKLVLPATNLSFRCYQNMFEGCTSLTTAPEILPATTLAISCYHYMFYNCTSLTTAPELPATTLASSCYSYMFLDCTSLTTAPELPATTLAGGCYYYMFFGCSSLTTAPEILPATTLASNCYNYMFGRCHLLTTAPELPAITLVDGCYIDMFNDCRNLNYIKAMFTTTPSDSYTHQWVSGVASEGTFVKNIDAEWSGGGNPKGWTIKYNVTINNIEIVDDSEIPETIFADVKTASANIRINYIKEDSTTGSFISRLTSNEFGENTTGSDRQVTVTFEYEGKTTSVTRTQTTEYSPAMHAIHFENVDTQSVTISLQKNNDRIYSASLEKSTDNITWEPWGNTSMTPLTADLPVGGKLYVRASDNVGYFNNDDTYRNSFTSTGKVSVGGNIMSLGYKDFEDKTSITQNYAYCRVFYNMSNLVDVSKLVLPATTLVRACYRYMFYGCTGLTTAPELPATTLADDCYQYMFYGCTSLTTTPELLATTLAESCYEGMFYGCTGLTTAPELPATTLAEYCYAGMFRGCTGLTTAPELSATTLARNCYQYMFNGCSNLNYIKALFTTEPNNANGYGDTYQWVDGVASKGTFVKNPEATWDVAGVNGIPTSWDVKYDFEPVSVKDIQISPKTIYANTTAIKVQLTMVGDGVDDKSVTISVPIDTNETGSEVTKTIVVSTPTEVEYKFNITYTQSGEILSAMYFENVDTQDVTIGVKKNNSSANTATLETSTDGNNWISWGSTGTTALTMTVESGGKLYVRATSNVGYFNNSASNYNYFTSTGKVNVGGNIMSLGYKDFENEVSITQNYAYCRVFYNMSNLVDVSKLVLSATTLSQYCYQYMFFGCSLLTKAPELPASTLAIGCYNSMFQGCTSLTTAPALPATTLASNCYGYMFNSCTGLTTAPALPATTLADNCYKYMFYGCTGLTTAPELPATTLANYCYQDMFFGCTSLTTAPELPATTLANYCYDGMFNRCSNLNYIKALFTTTPSTSYTSSWVYGVASDGTFIKNPEATWNVTGTYGIPNGWVIEYDIKEVTSIEIVDDSEIPDSLPANQVTASVNIRINYIKEDSTTGSFISRLTSNEFGENTTGSDRQVTVTFEYKEKTTSVTRTQSTEMSDRYYPMYFENVDTRVVTISVAKSNSSAYTATLETSTDGKNWTSWGSTGTTSLNADLPIGERLYIRATTNVGYFNYSSYYNRFYYATGKVSVGGNIMSLGYKDFENEISITQQYAYCRVFSNMSNLVDASKLVLPATTLSQYCYQYMFASCTTLTTAPALPATTLVSNCYSGMFDGCKSLTTAQEILPATTLATYCYSAMFQNCTSLTTAPELPATTLASNCYYYMFNKCGNLNYIKALFTTTPGTSYTNNWLNEVASDGTFIKNPDASWDVTGVNGVPSGWTVETATE